MVSKTVLSVGPMESSMLCANWVAKWVAKRAESFVGALVVPWVDMLVEWKNRLKDGSTDGKMAEHVPCHKGQKWDA